MPSSQYTPEQIAEITTHHAFDPELLQRVSFRKVRYPLAIHEPDPTWPARFQKLKKRLEAALGDGALEITHVGSTSVPGLPAKDVVDIDLTVHDSTDEASYVPALEAAGFQFMTREPHWHEHRFFVTYKPDECNLHVWSPGSPEAIRHKLFRDWLIENEEDRKLYYDTKRACAAIANEKGENVMAYNFRKENTIREILHRAFKANGIMD